MAYIRKIATGWRAEVQRKGVRKTQVLPTKAQAQQWAAQVEAEILRGAAGALPDKTLADALDEYGRVVSLHKRGHQPEMRRIAGLLRDFPELCGKVMHQITPADIARWRDARRVSVADSTVVRDSNMLRHVWTVAIEWGWCKESPWQKIKLPTEAMARTRRTSWSEVKAILRTLRYRTGEPPASTQQQAAWAYLVAQHTALRAGEVRSLSRSTVDLHRRVLTLREHKTMEREGARLVPFTRKAARVLAVLDEAAKAAGRDAYLTISASALDAHFRRARDMLMLPDLHFHDSRADALTRLSRRMDVMRLSRVSGHRDLRQLLQAYYRESAADIAASL